MIPRRIDRGRPLILFALLAACLTAAPLTAADSAATKLLKARTAEFRKDVIEVTEGVYTAAGYSVSAVSMIVGTDGVVIVDTGMDTVSAKAVWRYTTQSPGDGWEQPGFDAGDWKEGPGGFGRIRNPAAPIGTPWRTSDIWLRRTVRLKTTPARMALLVFHDEDAEVYLNGVRVAAFSGFGKGYVTRPLDARGRQALRPGENLLAVHCRQTTGGQFIDVHLIDADK